MQAATTSGRELAAEKPRGSSTLFELFVLSRRHEEIASEYRELLSRPREQVAALLRAKEADGVLHLEAEPDAVVDVLLSLADGIWLRMLAEERDFAPTIAAAVTCVRALLDDAP